MSEQFVKIDKALTYLRFEWAFSVQLILTHATRVKKMLSRFRKKCMIEILLSQV